MIGSTITESAYGIGSSGTRMIVSTPAPPITSTSKSVIPPLAYAKRELPPHPRPRPRRPPHHQLRCEHELRVRSVPAPAPPIPTSPKALAPPRADEKRQLPPHPRPRPRRPPHHQLRCEHELRVRSVPAPDLLQQRPHRSGPHRGHRLPHRRQRRV